MSLTLPSLDAQAKTLSDALTTQIMDEIKQKGPMTFARFMELALYAPKYGYYRNGYKKFGSEGDFVTAPEISSLFSQCLANHCADVLANLNGGDIVEFGAGSGVMAADILLQLQARKQLPNHYYIIELSAALKMQQREMIQAKIPQLLDRVIWLDQLPQEKIRGVVLANEVLDAMPVHQFVSKNGIKECGVTIVDNMLTTCVFEKTNETLQSTLTQYDIDFSDDYCSEVNLHLPAWIKSIADFLDSGVVVLIDYGFTRSEYYHPDRSMGTLMCHYRHYSHGNPLILVGMQDITAHVDFTAVAEAADANGCDVVGFANQAAFLMDCGLLSLVEEKNPQDEKTRFALNQQILKLTMPSEMGELFKVMALTKNYANELIGFRLMNQLERL